MNRVLVIDQDRATREAPRAVSTAKRCPAALGRNHSFTMRGNDGQYRCWYCALTRDEAAGA